MFVKPRLVVWEISFLYLSSALYVSGCIYGLVYNCASTLSEIDRKLAIENRLEEESETHRNGGLSFGSYVELF